MGSDPLLLVVLDGWGVRAEREHNAIALARTPTWDELLARFPHTTLEASGEAVGLPDRQMGNSEVGHMNMGAGRVVYQELQRIMPAEAMRVRGRHNASNALAALALATAIGCPLAPMLHGLREYGGEPHRVGDGVRAIA